MSNSSRKPWVPAVAGAVLLALGATGVAQAQGSKEADAAIKYRKSLYTVLVANFGPLGAMASGKAPFDAAVFKRNSARVAFLAGIAPEVFPEDLEAGDTKAKPEIWTNKAEFDKLMKDLGDKTGALAGGPVGHLGRRHQGGLRCGGRGLQGLPRQVQGGMIRSCRRAS